MDQAQALLRAIHADPGDETAWLALADRFEEGGEPDRAELARLHVALRRRGRSAERLDQERRARALIASGERPTVPELVDSIGVRLALVPPGSFLMGSPDGEARRSSDEGLVHEVTLTRPFYLGVFPVTVAQFACFLRATAHPRRSQWRPVPTARARKRADRDEPIWHVSWNDAVAFCTWLGEKEGAAYRLPTEAEWEYACRAGWCCSGPFTFDPSRSSALANFDGRASYPAEIGTTGPYLRRPSAIGSYPSNAWGLYDMHGNVFEWCADRYGERYSQPSPLADPTGPPVGHARVVRGGSWYRHARYCRAASRDRRYAHAGRGTTASASP